MAAGPDGDTDFIPGTNQGDQSLLDGQLKMLEDVDTMVLGRVTYELFSGYWPKATEGEDKDLAKAINGLNKFVFSNTIDSAPWGPQDQAVVLKGDAVKELPKLKEKSGKDIIIWGSISLAQSLINAGLIDEYRMFTCPIVLGEGRPFFDEKVQSLNLKLIEAKTLDRGSVELKYTPAKTAAGQTAG